MPAFFSTSHTSTTHTATTHTATTVSHPGSQSALRLDVQAVSRVGLRIQARVVLLGIILIAFAWRVHALTAQSLWRDEVDAIYFALRPLAETLSMFTAAAQNGPLYFLALRPWFRLVGSGEFALRYPSAFAGVLSIPLLWQIARTLLTPATAQTRRTDSSDESGQGSAPSQPARYRSTAIPLLAALFLAVNPYQLWYSQEGKMYAIIVCLMLASSWLWLMGIERGTWRHWLLYLIVTSLSFYTHLLMVLVVPVHFLWFVIAWPQSKRQWRGYGCALAGLTLPYLPMVWWQWEMLTSSQLMTGFTFTPIDEMLRVLLFNHSRGFMPPTDTLWMAPIFFVGLAGLLLGIGELGVQESDPLPRLGRWRRFLLLVAWLFAPILLIYGVSLRQPVFVDRYIIWIAPAAMMMLALGIHVVWHNAAILSKPLTIALVIYIVGFWLYAGWQQKSTDIKYDLRSAVSYVAARRKADELLILQIPHMEYSYRYYSSDQGATPFVDSDARLGRWVGGIWTNNGLPDEQARAEVAAHMQSLTADADVVWVLRSEVEMWDARHLMDEWLEAHGNVTERAEFHGAQVVRYELP